MTTQHPLLHEADPQTGTIPLQSIIQTVLENYPDVDREETIQLLGDAYTIGLEAHEGDFRKEINPVTGKPFPFFEHPSKVMSVLANRGYDPIGVATGPVHDVIDKNKDVELFKKIYQLLGGQIATVVDSLTGYDAYLTDNNNITETEKRIQKEYIARDLFSDLTREPRGAATKLADRLTNLFSFPVYKPRQQERIYYETATYIELLASVTDTGLEEAIGVELSKHEMKKDFFDFTKMEQHALRAIFIYLDVRKGITGPLEENNFHAMRENLDLLVQEERFSKKEELLHGSIEYIAYHLREGNEPLSTKLPNMPTDYKNHPLLKICKEAIRGSGEKAMYELFGKEVEEFKETFDEIVLEHPLRKMTLQEAMYFKTLFQALIYVEEKINNKQLLNIYFSTKEKISDNTLTQEHLNTTLGITLPSEFRYVGNSLTITQMNELMKTHYIAIPQDTCVETIVNTVLEKRNPFLIHEAIFSPESCGYRVIFDAAHMQEAYGSRGKLNERLAKQKINKLAKTKNGDFLSPYSMIEFRRV